MDLLGYLPVKYYLQRNGRFILLFGTISSVNTCSSNELG